MAKIDDNLDEEKDLGFIDEEEVEDQDKAGDEQDREDDSEAGDEEGEKEKEGKDEEEDDADVPEKFKGKTAKEIIKSYTELEGLIDKKAIEKAKELLLEGKGKGDKKEDKQEAEDDLDAVDFSKMDPKAFARFIDKRIETKALTLAKQMYTEMNEVKQNVATEISEAQKAHPHLKTNADYQDAVLAMITAEKQRGRVMTLKEACAKADKAFNIKVEKKDEEGKDKKKPRTDVERAGGSDGDKNKTDDEKVLEGIANAGPKKGPLGGLGF